MACQRFMYCWRQSSYRTSWTSPEIISNEVACSARHAEVWGQPEALYIYISFVMGAVRTKCLVWKQMPIRCANILALLPLFRRRRIWVAGITSKRFRYIRSFPQPQLLKVRSRTKITNPNGGDAEACSYQDLRASNLAKLILSLSSPKGWITPP